MAVACYGTVWYAASSFLSTCAIWSLRFVFSLVISPRYLYVPVRSSSICPSVNLGLYLVFLIIIVWLFSFPNLMWYFSATLLVVSSSFYFSLGLVSRSRTSSIHSRHAMLVSMLGILIPRSVPFISLFISSISSAYWGTDNTPPCLMLSLIAIFLVGPYFVWTVAVRVSFCFLLVEHIFEFSPLLCITYMIASIQALL